MLDLIERKNADDFGYSSSVNHAISSLVEANQVNCVSVMVNGPYLPQEDIAKLIDFRHHKNTKIGIHFNISEFSPIGIKTPISDSLFFSKRHLYYALNREVLSSEIEGQLKHFKKIFGFSPDYFDSHLHVHQWPIFRNVFLQTFQAENSKNKIFVRNTSYPVKLILRSLFKAPWKLIIKVFCLSIAGSALKKRLNKLKIQTNQIFLGVNPFYLQIPYQKVFDFYSGCTEKNAIYMIHPAMEHDPEDPINRFRLEEYAFLQGSRLNYGKNADFN